MTTNHHTLISTGTTPLFQPTWTCHRATGTRHPLRWRRISADHFVHVRRNDAIYDWQSLAGGLDITGIIDESFATLDDDTAALCRAGRFGAAGKTTFVLENSTVLQFTAPDPCLKALFAASERMAAQIVEMVHAGVEI